MFCRYCGQEIPNDSMVCTYCGKKLRKSSNSRVNDTDVDEKTLLADLKSLRLSKQVKKEEKEQPKYSLPTKKRIIKTKYIETDSDNKVEIVNSTPVSQEPLRVETPQPAEEPVVESVVEEPVTENVVEQTPVVETPVVEEQAPVEETQTMEETQTVEEVQAEPIDSAVEENSQPQQTEEYVSEADKQLMDLFGVDSSQPEETPAIEETPAVSKSSTQPEVFSSESVEVPQQANDDVNVETPTSFETAPIDQVTTEYVPTAPITSDPITTDYVPTEPITAEPITITEQNSVEQPGFTPLVIEDSSVVSPDQMNNSIDEVQNQENVETPVQDEQVNQESNFENQEVVEDQGGAVNYEQLAAREQAYVQQMEQEPQGDNDNFNFNPDNQKQPKVKKDKYSRSNILTVFSLIMTILVGLFMSVVLVYNAFIDKLKGTEIGNAIGKFAETLTELATKNTIVVIVLAVIILLDFVFALVQIIRKRNAFAWINFVLFLVVMGAIGYGLYSTELYKEMLNTIKSLIKK